MDQCLINLFERVQRIIDLDVPIYIDLIKDGRHLQADTLDIGIGKNIYIKYDNAKEYSNLRHGEPFIPCEKKDGVFCIPYDDGLFYADITETPYEYCNNPVGEHYAIKGGYIDVHVSGPFDFEEGEWITFLYTGINKYNYKSKYLKSETWFQKRKGALDRANNKCQLCSSRKNLNVHHNTYENVGDEKEEDLIVLCGECHKKYHSDKIYS